MSKPVSLLLVATMSLALTGCFTSDQPKFPLTTASSAFGDGGRYEVLEREKGDGYRHQEVFVVRHLDNGGYEFVNEKGEVLPISFHPLAEGVFIGQAKPEKDKPGYGYVVFKITRGEALVYAPQCDDQDKATLKAFNVTLKDKYSCVIDGVTDLRGLFSALNLGEPMSKMVRQPL
jgi:hypothetical protein